LTDNHNGVLSGGLVDVDECFARRYIFTDFPREFYVGLLHLFFKPAHGVIISSLPYELTEPSQFTNSYGLISAFTTVGGHVV
jgi:hypothetical protein